ncbi:MAG: UDP-glucose 6-dehydrogenase [Rickettsiales bacterium]|nr:MAG: UDP-glucose 6-dehydrogenase [Rickettsiales bacterium]
MKIAFIGTGYVGLVSGVMMSHLGHDVVCLDVDENKINKLKNKEAPIYEAGLDEYLAKYANSPALQFVLGYDATIQDTDCLFVTVGTPPKEDGDADLSGIFDAVQNACKYVRSECVIVLKSTVPPGTCAQVREFMQNQGKTIHIVSNPEFLREGSAIKDFLEPDRIVIGAESEHAFEVMRQIYKPLTDAGVRLIETDLATSELIKYASNMFLANKIAFINEMADLCEVIGADISTLSTGVGTDKRIGEAFLKAGPGFGGSCFPKDILALQQLSKKVDSDFLVLDAVIKANSNRPGRMLKKISKAIGGDINGKKFAVLGLTYKAETDDLRSSPAIDLINLLQEKGGHVVAYDPEGMVNADKYFRKLDCASSAMSAIEGADAIIIATEWEELKKIDLEQAKRVARKPVIIDLRNILCPKEVLSKGFEYYSIGRKNY